MADPDLLAALHALTGAVCQLADELRQQRQAEQANIVAIVALHHQKSAKSEEEENANA